MSGRRGTRRWRIVATIFAKEARDVLRDRRAAFFTFVFPLILYPAVFLLAQRLDTWDERHEGRIVRVGLHGDFERFYDLLRGGEDLQVVPDVDLDESLLLEERLDLLLDFQPLDGDPHRVCVVAHYDGTLSVSREALERLSDYLERYRLLLFARRFEGPGADVDPAALVVVEARDTSEPQERGEALLGRILPALLILLLVTSGAFVAVDIIAGEKERGTLETLFIHPVSPAEVTAAKFLVVLACSLGGVVLNLLGMVLAYALGLSASSGVPADLLLPGAAGLLGVALLLLPLAVLSSGVLIVISSLSGSFREAQTFLIPFMVLGLLPALFSAIPGVELNLVNAWIPVANIGLAVREALSGDGSLLGAAIAFSSTALYAALTLWWSASVLNREEVVLGTEADPMAPASAARSQSRRVLAFGAVVLLSVYYVAPVLQAPNGPLGLEWGLIATLWGLVLGLAAGYTLLRRLPLRETWALHRPRASDVLVAVASVPAVALLVGAFSLLQDRWLPFSREAEAALREIFRLEEVHPLWAVFIFAVSPAICEEALWRGAFQGALERTGRPLRTVLLVGLFFGLFHLSIYRLAPAAIVGVVLAGIRWRTGSIIPCVIFHGFYNFIVLFALAPLVADPFYRGVVFAPSTLLVAAGVVFLAGRRLGPASKTVAAGGARRPSPSVAPAFGPPGHGRPEGKHSTVGARLNIFATVASGAPERGDGSKR